MTVQALNKIHSVSSLLPLAPKSSKVNESFDRCRRYSWNRCRRRRRVQHILRGHSYLSTKRGDRNWSWRMKWRRKESSAEGK